MPAHMQIVPRRDERRLETLECFVQRAELEIRETGPEETLLPQHLLLPFFWQKSERGLE
jgi:hypothetical protein